MLHSTGYTRLFSMVTFYTNKARVSCIILVLIVYLEMLSLFQEKRQKQMEVVERDQVSE